MPFFVLIKSDNPLASSFFPQSGHVDSQSVFVYKAVCLPQLDHDVVPADHLSLVLQKKLEDFELVFGQVDFSPS